MMNVDNRRLRVIVLQHVAFEGPALVARWFEARGHLVTVRRLWLRESAPRPKEGDVLVVMGGPMSVFDDELYGWLPSERAAIRDWIDAGRAVLGICLGAQLIAAALGARVFRARQKEIGWWPVDFERDFGRMVSATWATAATGLPARTTVFHWHGDTFSLPEGAVRLASSPACMNQAFLYEDRVLALQFHLESTRESVSALAEVCVGEIGWSQFQVPVHDVRRRLEAGATEHGGAATATLYRLLEPLERVAAGK